MELNSSRSGKPSPTFSIPIHRAMASTFLLSADSWSGSKLIGSARSLLSSANSLRLDVADLSLFRISIHLSDSALCNFETSVCSNSLTAWSRALRLGLNDFAGPT
jgi:hypothetical protein